MAVATDNTETFRDTTTDDGEGEEGEAEEGVDDALDDEVEPAAAVGAGEADGSADEGARRDAADGDGEGGAGAVEDAGEDVAAEVVGAEEEVRAGGLESSAGVLLEGVARREDAGEECGEDREGDDGRGGRLRRAQWEWDFGAGHAFTAVGLGPPYRVRGRPFDRLRANGRRRGGGSRLRGNDGVGVRANGGGGGGGSRLRGNDG